jgi:hypothetical protein
MFEAPFSAAVDGDWGGDWDRDAILEDARTENCAVGLLVATLTAVRMLVLSGQSLALVEKDVSVFTVIPETHAVRL